MKITVTATSAAVATAPGGRATADDSAQSYILDDPAGTAVIYLENAADGDATTADGLEWDFGRGSLTFTLEPGESMNARTASGSVELSLLRAGR